MPLDNEIDPSPSGAAIEDTTYCSGEERFEELREKKRRSVIWPAILHVGDHKFDCQIRNFSMGGLKLKLNLPFKEGTAVRVEIPMRDITLNAEIAWQADKLLGLCFLEDEDLLEGIFNERASGMGVERKIPQSGYRAKISSLRLS